jgi:REP element-mobilizing transposase RayT
MTHIARIIVHSLPDHVTQRGNRGERIFFEADFGLYKDWFAHSCRRFGVACWAFCLMPNHKPLLDRAPRFADLLESEGDERAFAAPRRSELIGRPLGGGAF